MALADVGGFYDGLRLVLMVLIGPISAIYYENDLMSGKLFAKKDYKGQKKAVNKLSGVIR